MSIRAFLVALGVVAQSAFAAEGELTITNVTLPTVVDLTAEGTADWAHWGRIAGSTILHRKDGTQPAIGELTRLGPREAHTYENSPTPFTWSDGSPTREVKQTRSGVFVYGEKAGFQLAVPADTTPRTVKVFCGAWRAQGKFEAALSDGSAPAVTVVKQGVEPEGDSIVFHLRYRAASAGQKLTLKWANAANRGNVTIQAVTLREEPLLEAK